jgi:hypothetical protein
MRLSSEHRFLQSGCGVIMVCTGLGSFLMASKSSSLNIHASSVLETALEHVAYGIY